MLHANSVPTPPGHDLDRDRARSRPHLPHEPGHHPRRLPTPIISDHPHPTDKPKALANAPSPDKTHDSGTSRVGRNFGRNFGHDANTPSKMKRHQTPTGSQTHVTSVEC
jgi:hypothetical protein